MDTLSYYIYAINVLIIAYFNSSYIVWRRCIYVIIVIRAIFRLSRMQEYSN